MKRNGYIFLCVVCILVFCFFFWAAGGFFCPKMLRRTETKNCSAIIERLILTRRSKPQHITADIVPSESEMGGSDMRKPYLNVIGKVCTHALNILDSFHVKGHLTDAVNETCKSDVKKFVRLDRRHRELLLNWFRSRGVVEGFNNKVKLTARKGMVFKPLNPLKPPYFTL